MKYSEFMRRIERQGLKPIDLGDYIEIRNNSDDVLFCVEKKSVYVIDLDYDMFREQDTYFKRTLFNLAVELASTPPDEREDKKRYRLKLPFAIESVSYLNISSDGIFISSVTDGIDCKTIFTESEIEELKRKHNLDSFVLEEVKEDE